MPRKPGDHTVQRVLADGPRPSVATRRYPPCEQIADPYQRRHAVVKLHSEGWSITNMSGYLQTPRHRVYEVLKRWVQEGHAGLDDKPRMPHHPARKVTIREINEVRKLAEVNPEPGAYRVRAALEQEGIILSQATCGRLLALNRQLYGLAQCPHEWLLDFRVSPYAPKRRMHRARGIVQLPLFTQEVLEKVAGGEETGPAAHPRDYLHLLPKLTFGQESPNTSLLSCDEV